MYRPPNCPVDMFSDMIDKVNQWISNLRSETEDPTIYITGDFNMNFLKNWDYEIIQKFYNSTSDKMNSEAGTSTEKIQAIKLIDFVNSHYLSQMVVTPTREDNILDYIFVNKENFVNKIVTEINSYISDHNTIIAEVDFVGLSNIEEKKVNHCEKEIPDYDLMNASDEQWSKAKEWMEELNYENITNDQLVIELENMVKHVFHKKEMNSKTS